MPHRTRRLVALFATALTLASALVAVTPAVVPGIAEPASATPPASSFDPGFIISDSVMFDSGTMSADQIQAFLESKVTTCSPTAAAPCLKDYRTDVRAIAPVANRCANAIPAVANARASDVIYLVARGCGVNPKVLLVTLQKEQGLVTSTSPTTTKYKIAMGYGCPDTAPCDQTYYGFVNQVYQAAYAYQKYVRSPDQYTAYQPGVRKIYYNPKASCGQATVTVRTAATGALYFYTPYVPNAAALANPYATGDGCSSYGNRNFWLYFNDWFGSPIVGGFIIATSDGTQYVLVGGSKWQLPRSGILSTLAPLGAVGTVSDSYAAGFPTAGVFGNLVQDAAGGLYLLDAGQRLTVTDCVQAADLGYSCAGIPTLTADMLAVFPIRGAMTSTVTTELGATYVLQGGSRREVLDAASAAAAGLSLTTPTSLLEDTVASVPLGAPAVRPDVLARDLGDGSFAYLTGQGTYRMTPELVSQLALTSRLGAEVGGLTSASMAMLPNRQDFAGLYTSTDSGQTNVLTPSGSVAVVDASGWGGAFVPVDPAFAALLAPTGQSVTTPLFVVDAQTKTKYLIADRTTRPATTAKALKALAAKFGIGTSVLTIADETFRASGRAAVLPGTLMKATKKSTVLWLVDGSSVRRPISAAVAKEVLGSATARVVAQTTIDGFRLGKPVKLGLASQGQRYLADGGILRPVNASTAARYGKKFGFTSYDATTIARLRIGAGMGRVFAIGSTKYQVVGGTKSRITSAKAASIARSTGLKTPKVHALWGTLLRTK